MKKKIVLSSISSDSHTWNLVYIQQLLEESGFQVINLGSCTPLQELIQATQEHQPCLIIISTINGHGYIEGKTLIKQLKQHDIVGHTPIVIGGQLSTKKILADAQANKLLALGYAGVFCGKGSISDFTKFIKENEQQSAAS